MKIVENTKTNLEITITFPSQENIIIIPRLVISGLLSTQKITLEEIENIKLIVSEAINLLIDMNKQNHITTKFNLEDEDQKILLKINISTKISEYILQNFSKNGLTIHILTYLCSKFLVKETENSIELIIEKEIKKIE
ncbi:MAG: hypothetical protein RMJ36_01060 [Candidatus Calescibacterium sp.]|nr:hypothetical protein [Candidatus Calescibacterium sp.]MDW8132229.1 hypothetical protein [Candidatus Calescibacterium sp.]